MTTQTLCPDCDSVIDESNELIAEIYNPDRYGACVNCYDPTPTGPIYSPNFEMEHNHKSGSGCCRD